MTRFAHCNRIFARSPHCSGVVSRALLCVLIAASSVQHAEAVLVGLALRCQDANATRNIPHVERTTEAVIVSMWKRALVHKLNTMALIGEILHVANAFLVHRLLTCSFHSLASTLLSRLETVACDSIVHRTDGLAIHGRWFFVEVSFSSSADPALVGRWRLPSASISDDGSFCARRLTARQAFVPAYRTHIVGFACYFDRACVQMSVFEFQHFGCG